MCSGGSLPCDHMCTGVCLPWDHLCPVCFHGSAACLDVQTCSRQQQLGLHRSIQLSLDVPISSYKGSRPNLLLGATSARMYLTLAFHHDIPCRTRKNVLYALRCSRLPESSCVLIIDGSRSLVSPLFSTSKASFDTKGTSSS